MGHLVGADLWSIVSRPRLGGGGGAGRRTKQQILYGAATRVYSAPPGLSGATTHLFNAGSTIVWMGYDHVNNKVIFADTTEIIRRCNIDGSSIATIVDFSGWGGDANEHNTFCIDEDNERLYFSNGETLWQCRLDGSSIKLICGGNIGHSVYCPRDNFIYNHDYGTGRMYRVHPSGESQEFLIPDGNAAPRSLTMALYFDDTTTDYLFLGTLARYLNRYDYPTAANEHSMYATTNNQPWMALAWDHSSSYMYGMNAAGSSTVSGLYRWPSSSFGGSTFGLGADLVFNSALLNERGMCIRYDGNLKGRQGTPGGYSNTTSLVLQEFFYEVGGNVYSVLSDFIPGTTTLIRAQAEGESDYESMKVDHVNSKLLVMGAVNDKIWSMNFAGTGFTTLLTSPVNIDSNNDMWVDEDNEKLYWTALGRLYSANLVDGSSITQIDATKNWKGIQYVPADNFIYGYIGTGSPYPVWKVHPNGSSLTDTGLTVGNDTLSMRIKPTGSGGAGTGKYFFFGDGNGDIERYMFPSGGTQRVGWFNSSSWDWEDLWYDPSKQILYGLYQHTTARTRGLYQMNAAANTPEILSGMPIFDYASSGSISFAFRYNKNLKGAFGALLQ